MRDWVQSVSNFRSLGFWSLLASGALSIGYWLLSDVISIDLQTRDVAFVGAMIGLGLDLFFRNTLIGKLLICALNAFYISIFFHVFKLTLGASTAREIREELISSIQVELKSKNSAFSERKLTVSNSEDLMNEIAMLRADVNFVMDEVINLDSQICEFQQDLGNLYRQDDP
ncbi:hypothetical protein [Phormidium tenue]|nr:hypothetical protein [Phormidium tenue]MBD2233626.1 hypothetical protein [Phormidium tenue FACHB-1052]